MQKKILSLLLALLLLLTLSACKQPPEPTPPDNGPVEPNPAPETPLEPEETVYKSGTIDGTDITWEVHYDRTLYVNGTGALPDFDSHLDQPWSEHGGKTASERSDDEGGTVLVNKIVIGEGITALSYNAFSEFHPLTEVILPSTLQTISYKAFYGCPNLKTVVGGLGVVTIEAEAFRNCNSLERIVLTPLLEMVEMSAFGSVIPNGSTRKLTLSIVGTEVDWLESAAQREIEQDNAAFENATIVYFQAS